MSSTRRWSVKLKTNEKRKERETEEHAEYVPRYNEPQLFKWKNYFVEVSQNLKTYEQYDRDLQDRKRLYLTMYTPDMSALSALVEEAREKYMQTSRPHIIVHTIQNKTYSYDSPWNGTKRKARRPLSSIILQDGVMDSLIEDAREFFESEEWYNNAGIPHHRGYLLYGPPGTGKSSTIYAIAGELGLEIYSLSLGSSFVDDEFLARAVASVPKQGLLLIEDIDCAFPSREHLEDDKLDTTIQYSGMSNQKRSSVTLSGLLNVLDGVGSEEGRIFFATTNYVDRLDPALIRPGRIDMKIQYKLATALQTKALFLRFYPETLITLRSERRSASEKSSTLASSERHLIFESLANQFASAVPEYEFSTAELQGFLLTCKREPERAIEKITGWVEREMNERAAKAQRERDRMVKLKEKNEAAEVKKLQSGLAKLLKVGDDGDERYSSGLRNADTPAGHDSKAVVSKSQISTATGMTVYNVETSRKEIMITAQESLASTDPTDPASAGLNGVADD